ncbi:MAG: type II secretion system F family protein [Pseudomonadota bacterium]
MPVFAYNAKNSSGQMITGQREAVSAGSVAAELSSSGMVPLKIELQADPQTTGMKKQVLLFRPKVTTNELIVFSHQMASLTKAGISIVRAVRTLSESSKNEYFAKVLDDVAAHLETGVDIASSMDKHPDVFNELYVSLVHVGENTGQLEETFRQIASYIAMEHETRKSIKAATRYPMFVMIAIAVAIIVLNIFVIPAFSGVFAKYGAELPWQTRAIVGVSDLFVTYWPVGLFLIFVSVLSFRRWLRTDAGRIQWDYYKMKFPVVGSVFERVYLARFCHSFAIISRAGVPLNQGLAIVSRAIGNEYMAQKVMGMRSAIERGENITQTARSADMFSPIVLQMMAVGEETGTIDELLDQAASFYEEEVSYELKNLTDAIEPILITAIAGLVLVMALGVFLPLWDLSSVAR